MRDLISAFASRKWTLDGKALPAPAGNAPGRLQLAFFDSIAQLPAQAWNTCAGDHPFVQHGFFRALEESSSVGAESGCLPLYIGLLDSSGNLVAAAPAALKSNSRNEYGPENVWIRAGQERNLNALPKLQLDVPLSPVIGPRLLVHPAWPRAATGALLLEMTRSMVERQSTLPTFNLCRTTMEEAGVATGSGYVRSREVFSIWRNRGFGTYAEFLGALPGYRASELRKEREKFAALGLEVKVLAGTAISPSHWKAFHDGYAEVCRRHQAAVALNQRFFELLSQFLGEAIQLIGAFERGKMIASCFCVLGSRTVYARHWSSVSNRADLLFELAFHRPVDLAIERGLDAVDGGVWAPHKAKRGYLPAAGHSAHWLRDDSLRAIASQVVAGADRGLAEGRNRIDDPDQLYKGPSRGG